jgi:hypothetical protein
LGKVIQEKGSDRQTLKLVDVKPFPGGIVAHIYHPAYPYAIDSTAILKSPYFLYF